LNQFFARFARPEKVNLSLGFDFAALNMILYGAFDISAKIKALKSLNLSAFI